LHRSASIKNGLKHMASSCLSPPRNASPATPKGRRRFTPRQPVSVTFLCWLKLQKNCKGGLPNCQRATPAKARTRVLPST
jgi:hypothetical protein